MLRRRFLMIGYVILFLLPGTFVGAQDTNTAQDYFAEVTVDDLTPYVGQQITYQFRFFDSVGVSNPLYEAPDFEGFWRIDKNGVTRTAQQLNNRQYAVAELQTALYPTRPGTVTIAPATITLPETVFRSEQKFATQSLTVDVKALPEGAPAGFTGAVGQFEFSATLDRQSASLGDTFTLRITVKGTGNVEQLALPDFPEQPAWNIYTNPTTFTFTETDGLIIGEKVYEYLFVPRQTGQLELPTMTLDYFDPADGAYRSINTVPISVDVAPARNVTVPVRPQSTSISNVDGQLALKPIASLTHPASVMPGILFWLFWLIAPFVLIGSIVWAVYQSRQNSRKLSVRASMALQHAQARLQSLNKSSAQSRKGYEKIYQAILVYFGDKLNKDSRDWSGVELEYYLSQINAPTEIKQRILLCLGWVNEGLYAPAPSVDGLTLARRTSETLAVLDQYWN